MGMDYMLVAADLHASSHLKLYHLPSVLMQRDKKLRPSFNGTVVVNPRAESSACNAVRQVLGGKESIRLINALASKESCEYGMALLEIFSFFFARQNLPSAWLLSQTERGCLLACGNSASFVTKLKFD